MPFGQFNGAKSQIAILSEMNSSIIVLDEFTSDKTAIFL